MKATESARRRTLPLGIFAGIVLALCSAFAMAAPAYALAAEKSFAVDGSMTITMQAAAAAPTAQQAAASNLAKTGDAALYLLLGIAALAVAALAIVRASRKLSGAAAGGNGAYGNAASQAKFFAAAAIAGLVAALCLSQFAAGSAYAAEELDAFSCSSKVVVNEKGEVLSGSLAIANGTETAYAVTSIQAPDGLEGWSAELPGQKLEASSGYSAEWSAQTLDDDLLQQLEDNGGELTLSMQITISREAYTYTMSFDSGSDGVAVESQAVTEDETATEPTMADTADYEFAGWYTSEDYKQAFDFSTPITSDITLYAKWTKGYWMAPAGADDPKANVAKTMLQVDADVEAIKNGDEAVIAEYNSYLKNDSMRLYTRWNGSIVDKGAGEEPDPEANKYVEFRILQVGDHDNEGCNITFQAAHVLPTAYVMNKLSEEEAIHGVDEAGNEYTKYSTTTGGWAESELRAELQEGGSIYSCFDSAFTDKILSVSKKSSKGDGSTELTSSLNKFWLPCFSELTGVSVRGTICGEGSQFTFYKNKGVSYYGSEYPKKNCFECLQLGTRTDYLPENIDYAQGWWLRSPALITGTWGGSFAHIRSMSGATGYYTLSESALGVSPAFCF